MKRRPDPFIAQRRRVFLGCEGESERSYGARLAQLTEVRHQAVHIDTVLLQPGSGDPLALVERAISLMKQRIVRAGRYKARAVLLDSDTRGRSSSRDQRALALADKERLRLIWQEPCHEALLLRHIEGCDAFRPSTSEQAMRDLLRHWPDYRKGIPASRLATRIDEAAVLRAATVDDALKAFLRDIGFADN